MRRATLEREACRAWRRPKKNESRFFEGGAVCHGQAEETQRGKVLPRQHRVTPEDRQFPLGVVKQRFRSCIPKRILETSSKPAVSAFSAALEIRQTFLRGYSPPAADLRPRLAGPTLCNATDMGQSAAVPVVHRPRSAMRLMVEAATAAPKPLSMLTTVTPVAQELSMPRRAASPPKLAP